MNKKRELAVKNAYIENSNLNEDFSVINDALYEAFEIEDIKSEQVKSILFLLPDDIFFDGIKWDFDDSGVRDDIYSYIIDNKEKIRKKLF